MHLFEKVLCVCAEDLKLLHNKKYCISWANFLLNPRRLRGSDFLMRWSQGVWSEHRLLQAVNDSKKYFALSYGPSGTAPDNDVRAFELYFERLEKAGLGDIKRPDILIFRIKDKREVEKTLKQLGGAEELPFISEDDERMQKLLAKAVIAVESENSLWKARQMPDFGAKLKPMKRLGGKDGLRANAVLPTVIIKEEDILPLQQWQNKRGIKIHIWHVFYEVAYGLSFDDARELIKSGKIKGTEQVFQAPGGATTKKIIYKFYYQYAYPLGEAIQEPKLIADSIVDKNGHILPFVKYDGGSLKLSDEAFQVLGTIVKNESYKQ